MDRRQFLLRAGLVGATTVFAGCRHDDPPLGDCPNPVVTPGLIVPQATRANTATSPLRVDVHSHIFNGHDVPMRDYFVRASLHAPPPIDELLKLILIPVEGAILGLAPDAQEEHEQLCDLLAAASAPGINAFSTAESMIRSEIDADNKAFSEAIAPIVNDNEEFRRKYRQAQILELRTLGIQPEMTDEAAITEFEIEASLNFRPFHPALEAEGASLQGVTKIWEFLKRIASRRYHNAYRMLELYGAAVGPVDVFAAATVDYDASLMPDVASTTVADQVRLMEAISVLTAGRILPFVGYDPRRDVATEGAALEDVKNAILEYGHVGVKLYPPMGFAAYGNSGRTVNCEWPDDPAYGERLDSSLADLYTWTLEKGVPLLAHSSESNGITRECQQNGSYKDWGLALENFPGLRACAGHFGGLPDENDGLTARMNGFIDLMDEPEARGFFADLAYLPGLFAEGSPSGEALAARMFEEASAGRVADHLVYGSDWYMIAHSPSEKTYASDAVGYLERIGGDELVNAVTGVNPARFLGLLSDGGVSAATAGGSGYRSRYGFEPHWKNKLP